MSSRTSLRSDAAQNRERLLHQARALFATADAPVSLEAIARAAGVGIGTLYRHFPTKQALTEAVYDAELAALDREADALLEQHGGFEAMRLWLNRYAGFVATKHAIHEALRITLTPQSAPMSETRSRINATIARFMAKGASDHSLRQGVQPGDVTLMFAGAVLAVMNSPDREQMNRVLDLLMAGLRAGE